MHTAMKHGKNHILSKKSEIIAQNPSKNSWKIDVNLIMWLKIAEIDSTHEYYKYITYQDETSSIYTRKCWKFQLFWYFQNVC